MSQMANEFYDEGDPLVVAGEAVVKHYGVPGMKWGHRKGPTSSSSGGSSSTPTKKAAPSGVKKAAPAKKPAPVARTPEQIARRAHHIKVGKDVTKAVLITVGTVALGSVAGPLVAAGAGAVARTLANGDLFKETTIDRTGPAYMPGAPRADFKPYFTGPGMPGSFVAPTRR